MNSIQSILIGAFFLLGCVLLLKVYFSMLLKIGKAKIAEQEKAEKLTLQLHPTYRQKVAEDRAFELETRRLAVEEREAQTRIHVMLAQFEHKRHLDLTRVQPETYIINEVPTTVTALPSLKRAPEPATSITSTNGQVQLPGQYDLVEIFTQHSITPERIFLGKDQNGEPIFIKASQLHHGAFNASTGRGKTLVERGILAQLLYINHNVILADLKFSIQTEEGLDYRPIAKRLYDQPEIAIKPGYKIPCLVRNEAEIAMLLKWAAYDEINRRKELRARGIYTFPTIDIFLEELIALIKAYPQAADDILRIIALGRELRVNLFTAAQNFLVKDTNLSGGARENFITALYLGGDDHSGSLILDMPKKEMQEYLRSNNIQLGRGIGMLRNEFVKPTASLVRLGLASNAAIYHLVGRADDFALPPLEEENLTGVEMSKNTDPLETPEFTRARELWEQGNRSDRRLLGAMKAEGFSTITLYQANQLANQIKAEQEQNT